MVKNTLNCSILCCRYSILCCIVFFGSAFISHETKAALPPIAVIIYDGENHTGESIEIRHNTPSLGNMNRKMTSFKVTPGFVVRFYEGENYTGGYYSKTSTAREAKKVAYNNLVRSVEILVDGTPEDQKPPVAATIYDGENYTGTSFEIRYDTPSFGTMNKKLSSIKVTPGYQVRFFTDDNYEGGYYSKGSDIAYAEGWDNLVNSAKIIQTAPIIDYASKSDSGKSHHEIVLDETSPTKLSTIAVNPTQIVNVEKPVTVNLDTNMYIEEGTFVNKTSFSIERFFVNIDGEISFIELEQSIPAYSTAYLGDNWKQAELIKMTRLGNNQIEFGELYETASRSRTQSEPVVDFTDIIDDESITVYNERDEEPPPVLTRGTDPDALRRLNAVERESVERVQRHERFWVNSPDALKDIIAHVLEYCPYDQHYTNCRKSPYTLERYAKNMHFGQLVSGINSRIWVKSSVWGMATGAGIELIDNVRSRTVYIWINPRIYTYMRGSNANNARYGEQVLSHEYYHNIGFSHHTGWPSSVGGVDNLFSERSYDLYRNTLGNRYIASNLAFLTTKIDRLTYEFEVYSHDSASVLNLRLLSTEDLDFEIEQSNTNKFILKFNSFPATDVYVSLYSENSEQMASTALDMAAHFWSSGQITALNGAFEKVVNTYGKIYVSTSNGAWVKNFYLPDNAPEGVIVVFRGGGSTSKYSDISDGVNVHRLNFGKTLTFKAENGAWVLKE